jgi:hypothetical protein
VVAAEAVSMLQQSAAAMDSRSKDDFMVFQKMILFSKSLIR